MNDTELDALLRGSAPRSFVDDDRVLSEARSLATRSADTTFVDERPVGRDHCPSWSARSS